MNMIIILLISGWQTNDLLFNIGSFDFFKDCIVRALDDPSNLNIVFLFLKCKIKIISKVLIYIIIKSIPLLFSS